MNIVGGTISFETIFESGSFERGLKTTEDLVKNFTSLTVKSGADIDAEYKKTAAAITRGFETIGNAINANQSEITKLTNEYNRLKQAAADAFNGKIAGGDDAYRKYNQEADAIQKYITSYKKVVKELEDQDKALLKLNADTEDHKNKIDNATNAQIRFRTELLNVKQKMMELAQAGKQATPEYAALTEEAKRLGNAMYAANQQVKLLTSTKGVALQGIISGLSGVAGAASVAQGAIGLFADKNEELQKIMLKVQSLMAITIGLQQVSQMLHSTSAFHLTFLAKAQNAYTASMAVSNRAAQMGVIANVGLAASFRAVGAAIKAIPVFGWILAGVSALIGVVSHFTGKAREAKKATEEFNKAVAESSKEQIASLMKLSAQWKTLGNDLDAQKKFLRENGDEIKKLTGKTLELSQADDLFIKNTGKFVEALILRARAEAQYQEVQKKTAKLAEVDQKFEAEYEKLKEKGGTLNAIDKETGKPMLVYTSQKYHELKKQRENLKKETETFIAEQIKLTEQEKEILKQLGLGAEDILEGSIEAVRNKITELNKQYEKATDETTKNKLLTQIQTQENLLKKLDGRKTGNSSGKDTFTKNLEDKKKAYQEYTKWLNSTDEIIRNSASKTFSELLKGGGSYKEYLNNQIASLRQLQNEGNITAQQLSNLQKLTTALQDETQKTVMQEFEKGLQKELDNARSIMEMLNIIEQRRKVLESDDSGLKEQKGEILDKQQEDVAKKAAEETRQLLLSYSAYLDEKINFELQYGERHKQLSEQLAKATSENERRIILAELAGLEKDKKKYAKQTGNQDYDNLLQEYRSFEQKKLDITNEYNKKKKILEDELSSSDITESQRVRVMQSLQELEKEYKKSLSELSVEILQQSDVWQKLFTNLNNLTVSEMLKMKRTIEAEFNNLNLSPEALKAIRDQLDKVTEHVQKKNPFAALSDALKRYKDEQSKANFTDLFQGIAASIDLVKGSLDAVIGGLKDMGIAGDEETQKLLGDISEMVGAAGNLAMGIATGNPLQIIQGGISLITSAFDVFNSKDRAANRSIKKHAEAINALESAYKQLEHAIKSALGESVYKNQTAAIQNMRQQQEHLQSMWKAEQDKKKTDKNKVNEYKEQYAELGRQIENMLADITASITQTTAKDLANQLADALVEAYGKGEDAAKSFEEVSRKVMQNAVKNALKLQFLETPLQNAIKQLQKDMGFDSEGNGTFDGLTQAEQDRFKREVERIGQDFNRAMEMYKDLFKDLEDAGDPTTSLSGAIKGASQESINLLAGQTNAVRVNQVEGIEIMRNSLIQLIMINANTSRANNHLEQIEKNTSNQSYDPLRSQGITG